MKGSKLPNVICLLPGSSDKFIIIGAHFDHVSEGDGIVDNWSGASLLPSLYQALRFQPRNHSFTFIGSTDGSTARSAQQMTKEQVAATEAMVNMDALGLAPPAVWATHANKSLLSRLV